MNRIRSASFRIAEEQNTDESSWVRGAEFYSCNGASGFFILRTDDREYIHVDVPLKVWHGFKEASSFGTYYNAKIKRRYRLGLY
ncbi:MAG: KTSC domain-containing protein [Flavobacteriales bacterium]|nr:KTSC domain-containing protein [Flavobacteriales bacterium]